MKKTFLLSMLLVALLFAPLANATAENEVPRNINYTGNLFDYDGNVINKSVTLTFSIYDSEKGGQSLWTETKHNVSVDAGYFSVSLGEESPIQLDFTTQYWVEIEVDGNTYARTRFTTSPYAFASITAAVADTATVALALVPEALTVDMMSAAARTVTGDIEGTYPELYLKDGVVADKIGQGTITNYHLSPSVTTPPSGPAGGALTGQYPDPKLAEASVEGYTIAAGAVSYAKLQDAAGDAGSILGWNGNAWVEMDVPSLQAPEVDGVIGNEVIWATEGLEILDNGTLGVGIAAAGVTNDMLFGDIDKSKFAAGDVHGQIMWWDNIAAEWKTTMVKPNPTQVLKFAYDANANQDIVEWANDEMTIPFAYAGNALLEDASETMLKLELTSTEGANTPNGIEVIIAQNAIGAGSALVATGSGMVNGDNFLPVAMIGADSFNGSASYPNGVLNVNATIASVSGGPSYGAIINHTAVMNDGFNVYGMDVMASANGTGAVIGAVVAINDAADFSAAMYNDIALVVDGNGMEELAIYANGNVEIDGDIDAVTGTILTLDGDMLTYVAGEITTLDGETVTYVTGTIDNLTSTIGAIATLTGTDLTYVNGTIDNLISTVGAIATLTGTDLTYVNGTITNLTTDVATIATLSGTDLTYTNGTITNLISTLGAIETLTGDVLTYNTGNFTTVNTTDLVAAGDVDAATGTILVLDGTTLTYANGTITDFVATTGAIETLTSTTGNITTVNATDVNTVNVVATGDVDALTGTIATIDGTDLAYVNGTIDNFTSANVTITGGTITGTDITLTNAIEDGDGIVDFIFDGSAPATVVLDMNHSNTWVAAQAFDVMTATTGTITTIDGTTLTYVDGNFTDVIIANTLTADATTLGSLDVLADAMVAGDLDVIGAISGDALLILTDAVIANDLAVGNDLDVTNNVAIGGDIDAATGTILDLDGTTLAFTSATFENLTVTTLATIQALDVVAAATVGTTLEVGTDLSVLGNAAVTGNTALTGTLTVTDVTTLDGEAIFNNAITINDATPVNTYAGVAGVPAPGNDGDLFVSRGPGMSPEWSNNLEMLTVQDLTANSFVLDLNNGTDPLIQAPFGLAVNREVHFGTPAAGNGCDVTIYGLLEVNTLAVVDPIDFLEVVDLTVTHYLEAKDLEVTDNLVVGGNISAGGNIAALGSMSAGTNLAVGTNVTVGGNVDVVGQTTTGTLNVTTEAKIGTTLEVENTSLFKGTVTINNGSDLLVTNGNITAGIDIDVYGAIENTSSAGAPAVALPVLINDNEGLKVTTHTATNTISLGTTAAVAVLVDLLAVDAGIVNFSAGVNVTLQSQLPAAVNGQVLYIVNTSAVNISVLGTTVNVNNMVALVALGTTWYVQQ